MNHAALLSFVCGFASLSLEILWVRLYGFTMASTPKAFGFVLLAYLVGIAFGARYGGRACLATPDPDRLWRHTVAALWLSAMLTLALPLAFVWIQAQWWRHMVLDLGLIAAGSFMLAFVFPIAHHLGAGPQSGQQGKRFATVYTSNVAGAALGPLVTGYILLDLLSLQQAFFVICVLQLCAAATFALVQLRAPLRALWLGSSACAALAIIATGLALNPHALIQRLTFNGELASTVVENRHGVITLFAGEVPGDDEVWGGNVYDGRTNLDLARNTNGLERLLLLPVLQPTPKRVLTVGLSISTWLALIETFPGVEHIDAIEINPGYLDAAAAYPHQARALEDERVRVIIDDARRWLRLHPNNRYDLIVMNTTWNWRANASLLLSREFMGLVKHHMAPEAIMTFNTTGSADAFFTAASVFPYAYRYSNFVYVSDHDFRWRKDTPEARDLYRSIALAGRPVFPSDSIQIEQFLDRPFVTLEHDQAKAHRPPEIITDDNVITEFKYGLDLSKMY